MQHMMKTAHQCLQRWLLCSKLFMSNLNTCKYSGTAPGTYGNDRWPRPQHQHQHQCLCAFVHLCLKISFIQQWEISLMWYNSILYILWYIMKYSANANLHVSIIIMITIGLSFILLSFLLLWVFKYVVEALKRFIWNIIIKNEI